MNGQAVRIPITSFSLPLLLLFALLAVAPSRAADSLISTGAVWKYLDSGTNQSNTWRTLTFDDSSWTNSGPAQLGFGDGDEATIIASNRQATTYFRRNFDVPDASIYSNLLVRLLR